jgi:hypothetical protein
MDDGRPSDADVVWAAGRTVAMHHHDRTVSWLTGRCQTCTADGCEQLTWAWTVLRAASMEQRAGIPGPSPH